VRVLDAIGKRYGHSFIWHTDAIGGASIDAYGVPIREETLELCRRCDAILFGAVGGAKWDRTPESRPAGNTLLRLRKELGLFANLRAIKVFPSLVDSSPLKPETAREVDLIIVRELIGGLYYGEPRGIDQARTGKTAFNTMAYSEAEVERVLKVAFQLSQQRSRRLLSVDKSNVIEVSRLWRETATRLGQDYPDVELRHMYVDTAAMALIAEPASLDVVVTENTFGDILGDEAAILSGSLGMIPSASLAEQSGGGAFGLYEPILHSVDSISVGSHTVNPIGSILSAALMLRYSFNLESEAAAIEAAVSTVLEQGYRTVDIARTGERHIGTDEMGELVVKAVLDAP